MGELNEYFLRHITLVVDNDQNTYEAANAIAREVVQASFVTMDEYRAMSAEDRRRAYAGDIGARIGDWLEEMVDTNVPQPEDFAGLLVRELLPDFTGSDLTWALGEHYMPEPDDMDNMLEDGENTL